MQMILKLVDHVWNLRLLKGHRTELAQGALLLLTAYQGAATSKELIAANLDLPDINAAVFMTLCAYFAARVATFAKESEPT